LFCFVLFWCQVGQRLKLYSRPLMNRKCSSIKVVFTLVAICAIKSITHGQNVQSTNDSKIFESLLNAVKEITLNNLVIIA
jgi:hypothetical protein